MILTFKYFRLKHNILEQPLWEAEPHLYKEVSVFLN